MIYALVVATVGILLLSFLDIFPGILGDLFQIAIFTSCLWFPALGIGVVVFISKLSRKTGKPTVGMADEFAGVARPFTPHERNLAIVTAVLIFSLILLVGRIPRRIVFAFCRPAFESQLATAPLRVVGLDKQLGCFHADRFGADSRGGVYFRTHAGRDGIGPDTMSYGFAYKPNPAGSPFGRAEYNIGHLFGDWYSFKASNDY